MIARGPLRLPRTLLVLAACAPLLAAGSDPVTPVILYLAVILIAAKLGGELAVLIGQPAVLGELVAGVVIGNLGLAGFSGLEGLRTDPAIDILSRIGVLLLLFEVGLESTVKQMLAVGGASLAVASLGVIAPFALGWGVGVWLLPGESEYQHAFLGATLCATSVGITARVLQDLNRSQTAEARIILGAAVIDDVMGLIILAVVTGVVVAADTGSAMSVGAVGWILAKSVLFLIVALGLGVWVAPRLFRLAAKLRARGALLATGLGLCFLLSWVAAMAGLAPIVGAFAAGLILEDTHFAVFTERGEDRLDRQLHPISGFLVPVFFVLMGAHTDLKSFAQPGVLGLATALTVAAVIGKQACSLGVWTKGVNRLAIGVGMIPRGEVGLIFASIGLTLMLRGERVVNVAVYSAVVVMVIVTTLVTPPLLKWAMGRTSIHPPA